MNQVKRCRYGEMVYQTNDTYVGRSFDLYGEFSEGEVALFRQLIKPGQVVLDIGSNIGAHTVPLAQFVGPSGRVLAFEPQRIPFYSLCANVVLNNLDNVVCHQAAVGEVAGSLAVPELDYWAENNFGGMELTRDFSHRRTYTVPLLKIDDLRLDNCHFMKIDVEGMERKVLAGAVETIRRFRPILYVEDDRLERSAELRAFLESLGFELYVHRPFLYNAGNFFKNPRNIFGRIISQNLYCHARDLPSPVNPVDFQMARVRQETVLSPAGRQQGLDEAVLCYRQAIHLAMQGKLDEAIANFEQALRLNPDYALAHSDLGNVFYLQGRHDAAVACYERAVRLKPDFAVAHNNMGAALTCLGRFEEAAAQCRTALSLKPDYAEAHSNLGNALKEQGQIQEAISHYQDAVRLKPDYAVAYNNLGNIWLLQGQFERGWAGYEWRRRCFEYADRRFCQPLWDGTPLGGHSILLYAEQGVGDALQFVRYAPMVQQRGGHVILECPAQFMPLLATCTGIGRLVAKGSPLPEFAVQAALESLPGILRTTLDNIPADIPYLYADARRRARWQQELQHRLVPKLQFGNEGVGTAALNVGIAWQGSPRHNRDRLRSVPLEQFATLAELPGVRLVRLQRGPGSEQLAQLGGRWAVLDPPGWPDDPAESWLETAALISALDLVVTVDTAVAHLAGALAVPVWVALPFVPDWRWLLEREDSPWYPTMRLFRQKEWGQWDDVFDRIVTALTKKIADKETVSRREQGP
jgi:FkbM family methyltransferase